jgi:DNA polymerase III epsilon subunit-like protein
MFHAVPTKLHGAGVEKYYTYTDGDGRRLHLYEGSCNGIPTQWVTTSEWDGKIAVKMVNGEAAYSDGHNEPILVYEPGEDGWRSEFPLTSVPQEPAMGDHQLLPASAPARDVVLVLDCETNGIGGFSPCTQDLCQLAFIACDRESGETLEEYSEYVSDAARRVCANHVSGFTLRDLVDKGVPAAEALAALGRALARWRPAAVFAHNASFDRAAVARAGFDWDAALPEGCAVRCTMREATAWCALPSRRGRGFKWPKLAELGARLGIDTTRYRLHDALDDCRLLLEIVRRESVWAGASGGGGGGGGRVASAQ